jgi:hypothetical protein
MCCCTCVHSCLTWVAARLRLWDKRSSALPNQQTSLPYKLNNPEINLEQERRTYKCDQRDRNKVALSKVGTVVVEVKWDGDRFKCLSNSERVLSDSHGKFVEGLWRFKCDLKTVFLCNTGSVWSSETAIVSVLTSVARWRLVKTGNFSVRATVTYEVRVNKR